MLKTLSAVAVLIFAAALYGCGFKLRGEATLPFTSAYIDAPGSSLAPLLARSLSINGKQVVISAQPAEITIHLRNEMGAKDILALSGGGKVREYRLRRQVTLSATRSNGEEVLSPTLLTSTRDFSYDDTRILAKEAEENLLYRDMDQELTRQIIRRLAFVRSQQP